MAYMSAEERYAHATELCKSILEHYELFSRIIWSTSGYTIRTRDGYPVIYSGEERYECGEVVMSWRETGPHLPKEIWRNYANPGLRQISLENYNKVVSVANKMMELYYISYVCMQFVR